MSTFKTERLKRAVIKEELVILTGDFKKAIILNQFLYWSQRVKDFDKFIAEERQRAEQQGQRINIEPRKGWIYKSAKDLSQETMLNLSPNTIRKHTQALIDNQWLQRRQNPNNNWDNTYQYRLNLLQIQEDLIELGYTLEGYRFNLSALLEADKQEAAAQPSSEEVKKTESPLAENESPSAKTELRSFGNCAALPETITEITNRNNKLSRGQPEQDFKMHPDFEEVLHYIRGQTDNDSLSHEYLLNADLNTYGSPVIKKALQLAIFNQQLLASGQDDDSSQPVNIYSYRYLRCFIKQASQLLATEEETGQDQQIEELCQRIIK
ncbi:hypothetical protein [Fuchsiella alkaliacetigena]|uniref:hypothetical protein n=1 Tax=Fuchsiella alkaliacetigena TaxID=957042 RepID=UPI00200A0789|nr:hypothetical protein [Fuchsiella alkaliacetigena]MCK8825876.1 hypothetical protein [Fuchsiella alkaliacetigena]